EVKIQNTKEDEVTSSTDSVCASKEEVPIVSLPEVKWKERGVGDMKILFLTQKKYYRVLMRRDQVLKVCASHVITKEINLVPSHTSNNGEVKVEYIAVRFKSQEIANSFKKIFEESQQSLSKLQKGQ
uniref:RanBD1 domain-containing protein n=1 Tax=Anas zonorhyncha TaxID=75864 RepID=A0A8B9ZNB0_9AVES